MNIPQLFEKRASRRRQLTGLLPGKLLLLSSGEDVPCKLVDLTPLGLGIISAEILTPGAKLSLRMRNKEVLLEVAWGKPDFGKQDLFRYGLKTLDGESNLEEVFSGCGCYVDESP